REKQRQLEKEARKSSGLTVVIPPKVSVKELAELLQLPVNKLIVELMKNGILATQNENIDHDTATIMAQELGFSVGEGKQEAKAENEEHVEGLQTVLNEGATTPRPPVVVVMGHVDHGKTKLLDTIRHTNVMGGEAGGITQHIGAYQVIWTNPKSKEKSPLTFIDTPGHEAFTVMRSRGAKVADIAVLVVAADDSVKPQTVEAINIIKAAKLPFVVAINKIDKPGADVQRVRNDLSQHNIISEEWGGEVPMVEISAKENKNIDKLLDTLLLVADMNAEAIKADPHRPAAGTVIEAHVDKGAGPVATILVQTGTLRVNDSLVVNGEVYGKVRALKNHRGESLTIAPPSTPARILGFKIAPRVGDILDVSKSGSAEQVDVRSKRSQQTGAEKAATPPAQEENEEEKKKVLNIVVKADTLGSLEAIVGSLDSMQHGEVGVRVVGKGLGNITADDATLAQTTGAILFGFNVNTTPVSQDLIQSTGIRFHQYKVIYDLLDEVKLELEKLLVPELITTELGNFKVMAIFRSEKSKMIVGGRVESGKLYKDARIRVKRNNEIIGLGKAGQLQSGKQSVNEIPAGSEGGLQFEGKLKLEVGDVLEAYKEEKKEKKLVLS
ncbi:MAG TPA: translation initiation factor IF-2, partial [Patescibacteria group bacterium]|nr:translation initiation factor IF-2 [Patescibacteria group bacterium]